MLFLIQKLLHKESLSKIFVVAILIFSVYTFSDMQYVGQKKILHAQVINANQLTDVSLITLNTPSINRPVTIEARSLTYDVSRLSFVWYVDGVKQTEGIGVNIFTINPKDAKPLNISIVATAPGGMIIRQSIIIKPSSVFLTWEGETVVPQYYKGRSLGSHQSVIRFVAIPELETADGQRLDPNNLIYRWKINGQVDQGQSGYGAQSFLHREGITLRPFTVEVDVENQDGTIKGSAQTTLSTMKSRILLYQEDPLYGVLYNRTINERINMTNNEIRIMAIPMHFSNSAYEGGILGYIWNVNGTDRGDIKQPYIVLRNPGNREGLANIGLSVDNARDILQSATKNIEILFTKQSDFVIPIFQ